VICPKCSATAADGALECARCGVIFSKLAVREPAAVSRAPLHHALERVALAETESGVLRAVRAAAVAGLAIWTWQFAVAPMGAGEMQSVLHLPNLVFHEAGHAILGFFGRFIAVLGGSLFQFAVPLVCAAAFLRQGDRFAAAICTWWAGQNLVDLAPYIADARALQLVLLGGKTGAEVEGHDWEYLLNALGWSQYDQALGAASRRMGLAMMAASLVWGSVLVVRGSRAVSRRAPM
jgi:hypothetical protein